MTALSLADASTICLKHIADNQLGSRNWTGGQVFDGPHQVACISYNGRIWALDGTEIERSSSPHMTTIPISPSVGTPTPPINRFQLQTAAEAHLFIADDVAWVGECKGRAHTVLDLPAGDDPRWIPGIPSLIDTQVLTLSPFYPSGRLGVSVEILRSEPSIMHPNHPPFIGCRAWMPIPGTTLDASELLLQRDFVNARMQFFSDRSAEKPTLKITEHPSSGYAARTKYNADSAGVTVAFAVDFTTPGERLTRSVAQGRYVKIPITTDAKDAAKALLADMQQRMVTTINVAGNGVYTLVKHQWNQQRINQYVFDVLSAVHAKWPITKIVSGGQTGADIAGAVAGVAMGVSVVVTMPLGLRQRDANNRDAQHTNLAIKNQIYAGVEHINLEQN